MAAFAEAEVVVQATIEQVWATMIDIRSYPEWNPFVVQIDCAEPSPRVGTDFILHVQFHGGQKVKTLERVSRLEAPSAGKALLEYEFLGPLHHLNLVRGKRQQYLQSLADGSTRYRTTERLTGLLSFLAPIGKVRDGFERHAAALKRRCELTRNSSN